jgi:hypothetical protein
MKARNLEILDPNIRSHKQCVENCSERKAFLLLTLKEAHVLLSTQYNKLLAKLEVLTRMNSFIIIKNSFKESAEKMNACVGIIMNGT